MLDGHSGKVISISITEDNQFIITASNDKSTIVWKRDSSKTENEFEYSPIQKLQEGSYILGVTISKDKQFIANGLDDGDIQIYKLEGDSYIPHQLLNEHEDEVNSVSFSTLNGGTLVSGSFDGSIRIWQLKNEKFERINLLNKPGAKVISVSISKMGNML